MNKKNLIEEYCPYCNTETGFEPKFVPQKCECGKTLLPCAQCHQLHSVFGCSKCPFEVENKLVVTKITCGLKDEVILEKNGVTFEDFYDTVDEYKEKYKLKDENLIERFFLISNNIKKEIYSHMHYDLYLPGNTDIIIISIEPVNKDYN